MSSTHPDRNEIMELERRGIAFIQAGDVASIVECFSDDSLVLSNGAGTVAGKESIRQLFSALAGSHADTGERSTCDWTAARRPTPIASRHDDSFHNMENEHGIQHP